MLEHQETRVLPPRVDGRLRGRLLIAFSDLRIKGLHRAVLALAWWGQSEPDLTVVPALLSSTTKVQSEALEYNIVTGEKHFREYLRDAQKVLVEVRDDSPEENVIGYGAVDRLARISDLGRIVEDVKIVDESGHVIGYVSCEISFRVVDSEARNVHHEKLPPTSSQRNPEHKSRPLFRPPVKRLALKSSRGTQKGLLNRSRSQSGDWSRRPILGKRSSSEETRSRVTFSDQILRRGNDVAEESSTRSSGTSGSGRDDVALIESLVRSRMRLDLKAPQKNSEVTIDDRFDLSPLSDENKENFKAQPRKERSTKQSMAAKTASLTKPAMNTEQAKKPSPSSGLLPAWNLNTARLKFISTITQLTVHVVSLKLKPTVLANVMDSGGGPKKHVLRSRETRKVAPPSSTSSVSLRDKPPVSLFVSYTVPPTGSQSATSFCSRKLSGDEVAFNQKSFHPVVFKPETLDVWWTSVLTFKVHSRALSQRVPALIGDATIALKYLLTDPANSNGSTTLRLPVYAPANRDRGGSDSEIAGDVYVCFLLSKTTAGDGAAGVPSRASETAVSTGTRRRPVSPQRAVRDGEEEQLTPYHEEPSNLDARFDTPPEKVHSLLPGPAERAELVPPSGKVILQSRQGRGPSPSNLPSSKTPVPAPSPTDKDTLFCLLRVIEGRNFSLGPSSSEARNLFASCRFFDAAEQVTSAISWRSTRPQFHLKHYLPVRVDADFLKKCNDNFMFVEIWKYGQPSTALGIAMLPLHQFYLAFKDSDRRAISVSSENPVIAVHDWLPVTDVASGNEHGQIFASLMIGTQKQISRMMMSNADTDLTEDKALSARSDSAMEEDHIYDSVRSESSASEEMASQRRAPAFGGTSKNVAEKYRKEPDVEVISSAPPPKASEKLETGSQRSQETRNFACQVSVENPTKDPLSRKSDGDLFRIRVTVEEAKNLPRVYDSASKERVAPSTYVTFAASTGDHVASPMVRSCRSPRWQHSAEVDVGCSLLMDHRRHFIVKLWHHPGETDRVDWEADHVIGFAAVDLGPLRSGFPSVSGWYNVMDFVGRCRGQMKISVTPRDSPDRLTPTSSARRDSVLSLPSSSSTSFRVTARYDSFPSHVVQHTEQMVEVTSRQTNDDVDEYSSSTSGTVVSKARGDGPRQFWNPPLPDGAVGASRSLLEQKLGALSHMTTAFKKRLEGDESGRLEPVPLSLAPPETNLSSASISRLQNVIESNLRRLERLAPAAVAGSSSTMAEPLSSASAEIQDVFGRSSQCSSADVRTRHDLDLIDWTLAGSVDSAGNYFRKGPEGESPEDIRS